MVLNEGGGEAHRRSALPHRVPRLSNARADGPAREPFVSRKVPSPAYTRPRGTLARAFRDPARSCPP